MTGVGGSFDVRDEPACRAEGLLPYPTPPFFALISVQETIIHFTIAKENCFRLTEHENWLKSSVEFQIGV